MELPLISVIVPVRNEASNILRVLRALEAQDYPSERFEVIVADGNSSDDTVGVVTAWSHGARAKVTVFNNTKQLSSAGRNLGVKNCAGEIVVFIDGHCTLPSSSLLTDVLFLMRLHKVECLCRPQPLEDVGNSLFQKVIAKCRGSLLGHGTDSTIYDVQNEGFVQPTSSGAIYSRAVFDRIGWYDETFDACEDVEFNYRVWKSGIAAYLSPLLTVYYVPRNSLGALLKQMIRYGQGRYRFLAKHPDAFSVSQILPAGFVLTLAILCLASFFSPQEFKLLLMILGVYAFVLFVSSAQLALQNGVRFFFLAPAVYFTVHGGLGIGFLKQAILKAIERNIQKESGRVGTGCSQ